MAGTSRYQFNYVELLLIHLGMALAVYFFRPSSTFILLGVIIYFLFLTIVNENKNNEALGKPEKGAVYTCTCVYTNMYMCGNITCFQNWLASA